jgi:FlaA1/EpsC-like NDP-sugar epimerase
MVHLSGADDDEIRLAFTGLRPGEKLHEELFTEQEQLETTTNEHIMMARHELTQEANARAEFEELISAAHSRDWQQMDRSLALLMPDWRQTRAASLAARNDDAIVIADIDGPGIDVSSVDEASDALTRPGQAKSKAS